MKREKKSNAGRKKLDNPRVTLSVRIKKETKSALVSRARKEAVSIGRIIDELTETM